MLRLLERIKLVFVLSVCFLTDSVHYLFAPVVLCFFILSFESSWSIVLTKSVLDRLTWSDLSICYMSFCLVVQGVVWLCHFPLQKVYTFMKLLWAAASNHKVLHLVSVISVSITGRGCRYFCGFPYLFSAHWNSQCSLNCSCFGWTLQYRGYFPNSCYCKQELPP